MTHSAAQETLSLKRARLYGKREPTACLIAPLKQRTILINNIIVKINWQNYAVSWQLVSNNNGSRRVFASLIRSNCFKNLRLLSWSFDDISIQVTSECSSFRTSTTPELNLLTTHIEYSFFIFLVENPFLLFLLELRFWRLCLNVM